MSLLAPVRRWGRGWPVTLPLYDGRECPLCKATICGKGSRIAHKEWHEQREEFDHGLIAALQDMAQAAGLKVQMRTWEEAGEPVSDPYGTVRVGAGNDEYEEDEDDE